MVCVIKVEGGGETHDITFSSMTGLGVTEGIRLSGSRALAKNTVFLSTNGLTSGGIRMVGPQTVADGVVSPSTSVNPTVFVDGAVGPVIANVVDGSPPI